MQPVSHLLPMRFYWFQSQRRSTHCVVKPFVCGHSRINGAYRCRYRLQLKQKVSFQEGVDIPATKLIKKGGPATLDPAWVILHNVPHPTVDRCWFNALGEHPVINAAKPCVEISHALRVDGHFLSHERSYMMEWGNIISPWNPNTSNYVGPKSHVYLEDYLWPMERVVEVNRPIN